MQAFAMLLAVCLSVRCAFAEPPVSGKYSGQGLMLALNRSGEDYTGTAELGGRSFEIRGRLTPEQGIKGSFVFDGSTFEWTARMDGERLLFGTGSSTYELRREAPANPLERKSTLQTQSSPAAAAPAAGGDLRMTRLSVKDAGMNNIEAVSFLIPKGWTTEGGVKWFPDHSILANLLMKVTDPATGAQVEFLPSQNFTWIENPVMPLQEMSNYMGNLVHRPIRDVPEFVRIMYTREATPHLAGARQVEVEELSRIAQQMSQAYGGQAQVKAQRVRYEYERAGAPWEEDVFVVLVSNTMQGITIWSNTSAYAFRARKGELDRLKPVMTAITTSARLSQDWFSGYMYVQQLFQNRMNQGIKNAAAISQTVTQNSEEIRRMFSDSYRKQQESSDRISRSYSEYIRGVETYTNPYESRPVQLPSGYQQGWVNAQGEYILSSQSGFDPNVGSTVEWRRLETTR